MENINKKININYIINNSKSSCSNTLCRNDGTFICLKDKDIICSICKKLHEQLNHPTISYLEYRKQTVFLNYEAYTKFIEKDQIKEYNTNMDKKNKFLYIDANEKKIVYGDKWLNNGMKDIDPFLLVSFYGYSGGGKSSTIGPLCLNGDYPIPGSFSTTNSTSSDINAFIGQTDDSKKLKYLILDSEGIGGTRTLDTIQNQIKETINIENFKIRSKFVKYVYPKIMYLFSDVIIFTFKGDAREKGHVYDNLVVLSKMLSNVSNNLVRPHVIILFNKQSMHEKFDDEVYAKKDYFENEKEKLEQLNLIFQSVSVFYLPTIDLYNRYVTQFQKLKKLVGKKLNDSLTFKTSNGYNVTKSDNMLRMSKAIGHLNSNPTSTPDMQLLNTTGLTRQKVVDYEKMVNNTTTSDSACQQTNKQSSNNNNNNNNYNNNNFNQQQRASVSIGNGISNGYPKYFDRQQHSLYPDVASKSNGTTSSKMAPTSSKPIKPEQTKPAPSKYVPTSPEPIKPLQNKPAPSKYVPINPETIKPLQNKSVPTNPEPIKPEQNKPVPFKSVPTSPEPIKSWQNKIVPTKPEPIKPEPIQYVPSIPQPIKPEPTIFVPIKHVPSNPEPIKSRSKSFCISNDRIQEIADNMITYFKLHNDLFYEKGMSRIASYNKSLVHFKSRLPDAYSKFLNRNSGVLIDGITVCEPFGTILRSVSSEIDKLKPCGSKNGNGFCCVNVKQTHNNHHQSKETYIQKISADGLFGWFKKKREITLPYTWPNTFVDPLNLVGGLDFYKEALKQPTPVCYQDLKNFDLKSYLQVCFGCISESPSFTYGCPHALCFSCSNDFGKCPVGCITNSVVKKAIDYNPLMGSRILSLDGGGIRGIVECCALDKLQTELYGIPIRDLFDFIAGTSTGGLIAISLVSTNKSAGDLVKTFERMAKQAFNSNLLWFLRGLSMYKRLELHKCFEKEVGNILLKDTISSTRIAVTSATVENGEIDDCIFMNYIRKVPLAEQSKYIYNASCISSAEATSAAPVYFSPFTFENRTFYDGGVMNNNPCKVAIKECKSLWGGNKKIDILLSLGTGEFEKNNVGEKENVFKLLGKVIGLLTSVKIAWDDIHKTNIKELRIGLNSFRVNAKFAKEIGLNQVDDATITLLKLTSEKTFSDNQSLNSAINKSISSLFYIGNLEFNSNNNSLRGIINCRLSNIPSGITNQLNSNQFKLSRDINNVKLVIQNQKVTSNSCSFDFIISNPNDEIDIVCSIMSASRKFINSTSISGCPFSLSSYINLGFIKNK